MEALLVRIDHFHDRKLYVSTVKTWLESLAVPGGRLVTMGEYHLLFVEATSAQHDALLAKFASEHVDTTAKDEPCIDRFIDVVGRKPIQQAVCKGFLEMNVLNTTLLERLMVGEWHCEKTWLDDALSTPRTKALIQWKEDAKNARKDRRKRAAQDRDAERAVKRAKAEEEKARVEAAKAAGESEDDDEDEEKEVGKEDVDENASGDEASVTPAPQKSTPMPQAPPVQLPKSTSTPQGKTPGKHKYANGPASGKPSHAHNKSQQHHKPSGARVQNGKKHHQKKKV